MAKKDLKARSTQPWWHSLDMRLIIVAVLGTILGLWSLQGLPIPGSLSARTPGIITSASGGRGCVEKAIFTVDHHPYFATNGNFFVRCTSQTVGRHVTVAYNPHRPSDALIVPSTASRVGTYLITAFLLLAGLFSLLHIARGWLLYRRIKKSTHQLHLDPEATDPPDSGQSH